jgi:hypothetical protein
MVIVDWSNDVDHLSFKSLESFMKKNNILAVRSPSQIECLARFLHIYQRSSVMPSNPTTLRSRELRVRTLSPSARWDSTLRLRRRRVAGNEV